jgi:glycine/D-amino acid oxidase-like deaminating enzyme
MAYTTDILIAGGGVIGSACAFFLKQLQPDLHVVVVEPDPSYRHAASALSASSIRQQFSTPVNIEISRFGIDFLRDLETGRIAAGGPADIGFVESSYLYLASPGGLSALAQNVEVQQAEGVPVVLHDPATLRTRYPWLATEDLAGAADTEGCGEGWFDGYALLRELRRRAEALGAQYLRDRVVDVSVRDGHVEDITLASGAHWCCAEFVNAAGTASPHLAARAGIELPVEARKRCVFIFRCATPIANCPLVIDPSGLWFRPEGDRFLCGVPSDPDLSVALDDFEVAYGIFDEVAWPALAARVPAFEAIRLAGAWAGHYDYNTFDQNAFVGRHPSVRNCLLASGFSGHGIQQAPAIGRGLAELVVEGRYRSLDLTPLAYARLQHNAPLIERNVI